jgi:hypothetical protein
MLNSATVLLRCLLLLSLILVKPVWAVEVIANPDVAVSSVSQNALRAMFAMKLLQWPDGRPVRVFVLPDDNPLQRAFCKEKLDLYPYQLRQTWDRMVYSGTGQAPTEVGSEAEMLSRVARTPGAIGYVRNSRLNDAVRVLTVE